MVHITSGVSALVCALYLGKRVGYPKEPMPPHSVVLSLIGACLLWVGWFGFNAGSGAVGGQPGDERICRDTLRRRGRGPGMGGSGMDPQRQAQRARRHLWAVAGLVAITPASGFVKPMPALVIGLHRRRFLLLDGRIRQGEVWV